MSGMLLQRKTVERLTFSLALRIGIYASDPFFKRRQTPMEPPQAFPYSSLREAQRHEAVSLRLSQ
jgi:hypothetical protein